MRPVEQLINEVRLLYQSLVQIGEAIHADSKVSMGMRAVLEYLDRNGDATVPDVARARRVSRQRIQTLVNPLLEMDLAESISNPASKRSPLITLTTTGTKTILEMRRREGRQMQLAMSETKIREAAQTLSELRRGLEEGALDEDRSTVSG
jgi:DNA-binding MarR family transcriptional regulator